VRHKRLATFIPLLSMMLVIGACGSNNDSAGGGTQASAPGSERDLVQRGLARFPALLAEAKAAKPASGTPIRVGFVTMERGDYVYKTMADSAENAVDFINSIGGIKGQPIELVRCATDSSPESSQNCATQMVNGNVVAVGQGVDFNIAMVLKALAAVGGSGFGGNPLFDVDRTAPNANFYYTSWADQQVEAEYAVKTLKAKKVAIISSDSSAGISLAKLRAQAPLTALGAKSEIFTVSSSATDFSGVATKALGFDAVLSNTGGLGCSGVPLALTAVGFKGPILLPDGCQDAANLKALGVPASPVYYGVETFDPKSDFKREPGYAKPELDLYQSVSRKADPNLAIGGHEQFGFAQMIDFAEALNASPETTFNLASVTKILQSSKGASFTQTEYDCGKSFIAKYPAYCSDSGGVYEWDGKTMTLKTDGLVSPSTTTS
jgi:branched-chain amino acid transport system substrate-binding protein